MVDSVVNPYTAEWAHLKPNQYCTLTVGTYGAHMWKNHAGQPHRVDENGIQDGPAVISPDGMQVWRFNGKIHRLDGPAIILKNGSRAIIVRRGSQGWYLGGEKVTQEQWSRDWRVIEFHSRTQEGAEQWLKKL